MFGIFYIVCGGNARLAADFVADLADGFGVVAEAFSSEQCAGFSGWIWGWLRIDCGLIAEVPAISNRRVSQRPSFLLITPTLQLTNCVHFPTLPATYLHRVPQPAPN